MIELQTCQDPDPYLPHEAKVVRRIRESKDIVSLHLQFTDPARQRAYSFRPGQFNMLYCQAGEVPISIVSNFNVAHSQADNDGYLHTIRMVGDVTRNLGALQEGDSLGVRGPFGRGWPLESIKYKHVFIITGGVGAAATVAAIDHMLGNREHYGQLYILQGIHGHELCYQQRYHGWEQAPGTEVVLTSTVGSPKWATHKGRVTDYLAALDLPDSANSVALICGPQPMMQNAVALLQKKGVSLASIFVSLERNMQCGLGQCGHCRLGDQFVCTNGPVFSYQEIEAALTIDASNTHRSVDCVVA